MAIKGRGFTLLELLIVTVIVGVLASFAVPAYMNAKRRASANEAVANLHGMIGAQKARRLLKGGFTSCDCFFTGSGASGGCESVGSFGVTPGCNWALSMKLIPTEWNYSTTWIAWGGMYGNAIRVQATKKTGTCTYQIDLTDDVMGHGAYNETVSSAGADCPF